MLPYDRLDELGGVGEERGGRAVALRGGLRASRGADRRAPAGRVPHLPLRRGRRPLRRARDDRPRRARVDRAARARRRRGARLPSDGRQPAAPLLPDRARGRRQRHLPLRGRGRRPHHDRGRARARPPGRRRLQPRERAGGRGRRRGGCRSRALHEHPSRLQRPEVHAGRGRADRAPARGAARARLHPGRRGDRRRDHRRRSRRRRDAARRRLSGLRPRGPGGRLSRSRPGPRVNHFERALELAERGRGKTGDHPIVGAVVVRDGEVVGEGWYEYEGVRHAEVIALEQAGDAARGAILYVTLEPCSHHGRTPPCADAVVAAGLLRVVVGARDPNPVVDGRGIERIRAAGIEVEVLDDLAARRQNEAWRVWKSLGRPFVTYKAAITLDGRVSVPGRRWVSGEESRRRVHELRAASDAVAVGMGTVRADAPRLDARDVGAGGQPRRLAFGRGPLPEGSELEQRSGPLEEELRALAAEGVRSLLLEGGPTLATAFLEVGLVDKLLLFVAPVLAGAGPLVLGDLAAPVELLHVRVEPSGEDLLLEAYLREP